MGANYWNNAMRYHDDLAAALADLQQRVLTAHDYDLDLDPDEEWPDTIEELWTRPDVLHSGTGSVLDVNDVIAADAPDAYATLRPLTEAELVGYLGTTAPTRAAIDAALNGGDMQTHGQSQSAYAVVAYDETGVPAEWVLWGFTGD